MITFETELDVKELELHRKLCWMDEVVYVIVEIEYDISKFVPATWWSPEEGGELEMYEVKVLNEEFSDNQCREIEWALPDNIVIDAIWHHYNDNNS